tara:strand:+ start:387 stop:953 length:567 start_codon:yes stop_codon:yes gene_type:complete
MGDSLEVKNTDFLKEVAKHHKEWLKTCRALGGGDFAEDIVQEMYIKLYKYASAEKIIKEGILQKGYVFFALKSILYTLKNEQSLVYKEELKDYLLEDTTDTEEQEAFDRFCGLIDNYLIDQEKEKNWYGAKMFQVYRETNLSMRKMANLSNISWVSIFHTLKSVKQDLRNNFQEDWEDYLNGDYDKIR